MKVSQYPEDKHGGYSDSVATLLQHNLIAINNLKQSMLATLLHTKTVIIINFWYSNSIWSGWVTGGVLGSISACNIENLGMGPGTRQPYTTYCIGRALHKNAPLVTQSNHS